MVAFNTIPFDNVIILYFIFHINEKYKLDTCNEVKIDHYKF